MGNQYNRTLDPDTEWEIVNQFSLGKKAKQIAYDLKVKISLVYNVREHFPLFARHGE